MGEKVVPEHSPPENPFEAPEARAEGRADADGLKTHTETVASKKMEYDAQLRDLLGRPQVAEKASEETTQNRDRQPATKDDEVWEAMRQIDPSMYIDLVDSRGGGGGGGGS